MLHFEFLFDFKIYLLCYLSRPNVWVAEKVTKRSSVLLICLVTFSATQTLSIYFSYLFWFHGY